MPQDFDFEFYRLFQGGLPLDHCLSVGDIPGEVARKMGWSVIPVLLSGSDAQKIRFHQQHAMPIEQTRMIFRTIVDGDYYIHNRGGGRQVEAVFHSVQRPKELYFAVVACNASGTELHLRTFFRSTNTSHSKFKGGTRLRWVSGVDYFRGLA